MRKCRSHLGQTLRLSSRSFFQMIWRHWSHFTHSPSVRTLFSPEVSSSPDCLLNQAMGIAHLRLPSLDLVKQVYRPGQSKIRQSSIVNRQYSIPLFAVTPFSYACFTCRISVTVSPISTIVRCA